jgi:uncharacterized cupredoxin-like copper-binding protein
MEVSVVNGVARCAVVALAVLSACGARASPSNVRVTVDEWSMQLSTMVVNGGTVTLDLVNIGHLSHSFVVLKSDAALDGLPSLANDPSRVDEAARIAPAEDVAAGAERVVTFDLRPGHYILICDHPDHYRSGIRAGLDVRWP